MCYFKGNWRVGVEGKWAGPKERSLPGDNKQSDICWR